MDNNYIPQILIVAPYPGLVKIAEGIKRKRIDVHIDIELGNLKEGVFVAKSKMGKEYDAVISRGGTLLELQKEISIPVIEIKFSTYDMVRIIEMTDDLHTNIAFVGFSNFTKCAEIVCALMNKKAHIITIRNEEEARDVVKQLRGEDVGVIIGDQVVHSVARENNMNCILFLSGPEAVEEAVDQAIEYSRLTRSSRQEIFKLHTIINNIDEKVLARDEEGNWLFCNFDRYREPDIYEFLERKLQNSEQKDFFQDEEYIWSVNIYGGPQFGKLCVARKIVPVVAENEGAIQIRDWLNMPQLYYYKYYGDDKKMAALSDDVCVYGRSLLPVLLYGEKGVGKLHIAYAMHKESSKRSRLFAEIECENLTRQEFKQILEKYKNILYGKESGTVYLKNVDCLCSEVQRDVIDYIEHPSVRRNVRLIYSTTNSIEFLVESGIMMKKLGALFTELVLPIPPLRERPGCIEGIADMMLHEYNMVYGKQVVGFDGRAKKMLMEFHWPGNINQLKRVISSIIVYCSSYRISGEELKKQLEQEVQLEKSVLSKEEAFQIDLKKPLAQIERDIVEMVLKEEKMNKTKTAERLEIGRSTLWRILKYDM